jgi:hypothetical protein
MTSLNTAVASAERAVAAMMRRETPVRMGAQRAVREGAMGLMGWGCGGGMPRFRVRAYTGFSGFG